MSAAELEEEENASSESDEIDPDYSPNSDDDFSDYLSDTDGGSSDKSSHSCQTKFPTQCARPSQRGQLHTSTVGLVNDPPWKITSYWNTDMNFEYVA